MAGIEEASAEGSAAQARSVAARQRIDEQIDSPRRGFSAATRQNEALQRFARLNAPSTERIIMAKANLKAAGSRSTEVR